MATTDVRTAARKVLKGHNGCKGLQQERSLMATMDVRTAAKKITEDVRTAARKVLNVHRGCKDCSKKGQWPQRI